MRSAGWADICWQFAGNLLPSVFAPLASHPGCGDSALATGGVRSCLRPVVFARASLDHRL